MSQIRTILFLLIAVFLMNFALGTRAEAQSGGSYNFSQRAERRESSRWTLSEWLAQRDRNRLMDLWLSMNSPSPFEFMLGGAYLSSKTKIDSPVSEESYTSYEGELRAYAQFVGMTVEYANRTKESYNDLSGMLNVRLLGNSLQNSALTLHFGQRTRTFDVGGSPSGQRNVFGQVSLQVYLAKYFGIDGFYRRYEPSRNAALDATIDGSLSEAGVFIDFKAVRLFGAWTQDKQRNRGDLGDVNINREGIKSGIKIFY